MNKLKGVTERVKETANELKTGQEAVTKEMDKFIQEASNTTKMQTLKVLEAAKKDSAVGKYDAEDGSKRRVGYFSSVGECAARSGEKGGVTGRER